MSKSSIHFQAIKSNSQSHNRREDDIDYVNKELTPLNWSEEKGDIGIQREYYEKLAKEKTGRTMQKKATPIREAVFLFDERHTNDDLYRLSRNLCDEFGLTYLQLHVHRDEGHREKHTGIWIPNLHAHLVVGWMNDSTGKSVNLKRKDMSRMQDFVAEQLKMERGKKGSVAKRLSAIDYKIAAKKEELKDVILDVKGLKLLSDLAVNNPIVKAEFEKAVAKEAEKSKEIQSYHPPRFR